MGLQPRKQRSSAIKAHGGNRSAMKTNEELAVE